MGRRRKKVPIHRRLLQLRRIRQRKMLEPPFSCPHCGQFTLYARRKERDGDVVYVFFCNSCGFQSKEYKVRSPSQEVIDLYHEMLDDMRSH